MRIAASCIVRSALLRPTPLRSPALVLARMVSVKAAASLSDPSLFKQQAFVNGNWVGASAGSTFDADNPATREVIGSCPDQGVEDTRLAVAAAAEAFRSWSKTSPKHRHDLLIKLFRLLTDASDDIASIITLENGKAMPDAKTEATYGASFFEWFAEEAVRTDGDIVTSTVSGQRHLVIKQPIGVVGILCPWNFPLAMAARKVAPALACGCTVVVKAPAETPFTMLALAELVQRAGFPAGVFNVITTDKSTPAVGKELCENPTVRKISFTGSTAIGKLLMGQSASTLKKLSFELGGNAPFIVFDDADLDAAITGAVGCKFRCSGQTCICTNRFYIQAGIYDEFCKRFTDKVKGFKVGDGFDQDVTHGPLIHERALEKVERHVKEATQAGAKILTGGKRLNGNGYFFEPTVLSEVPPGVIDQEETFGPVAALYKFNTEEEVIELANNTEVGLAGYFYSSNISRCWRVAESLECGMLGVNTSMLSSAYIPFGGVKQSGFGREGSKYGIDEYMSMKFIAVSIFLATTKPNPLVARVAWLLMSKDLSVDGRIITTQLKKDRRVFTKESNHLGFLPSGRLVDEPGKQELLCIKGAGTET